MNFKRFIPRKLGVFLRKKMLQRREKKYAGSTYYCPVCKKSYAQFLDGGYDSPVNDKYEIIGAGFRKNIICPGCSSNDRERLLAIYFDTIKDQIQDKRILHIAPEPALGNYLFKLSPKGYTAGVKYHEGFYYTPNVLLMDITDIPFEDNTFDFIVCNHVLEHIIDDKQAMKELLRVLKPTKKAIIQVPFSPLLDETFESDKPKTPEEREEIFGQFDHVRIYGKDYAERLKSIGFNVNFVDVNHLGLNEDLLNKYRINPKEIIFVSEK
ncbi:MAG: class I SAM-dependent methyltransferase [Lentimicrobiaceae bacterium]|jgi:SAM-dependent methyltransferase|nr:class I SAM-dependent methyltransferase [Lentimicrobiaceae bacterium]